MDDLRNFYVQMAGRGNGPGGVFTAIDYAAEAGRGDIIVDDYEDEDVLKEPSV